MPTKRHSFPLPTKETKSTVLALISGHLDVCGSVEVAVKITKPTILRWINRNWAKGSARDYSANIDRYLRK